MRVHREREGRPVREPNARYQPYYMYIRAESCGCFEMVLKMKARINPLYIKRSSLFSNVNWSKTKVRVFTDRRWFEDKKGWKKFNFARIEIYSWRRDAVRVSRFHASTGW